MRYTRIRSDFCALVKMIADIHAQMAVITGVIDVSESFVIEGFNASCMPILVHSIDARARERGMVELPFAS